MKDTTLVILAAGLGSRFGGTKQLSSITEVGETIIDFSLYDAIRTGFGKVVFVVREEILSEFRETFDEKLRGKIQTQYVCQETEGIPEKFSSIERTKPWGTGHAVLMTREVVSGNFCVINADDFYGRTAFEKMFALLGRTNPVGMEFSMVGYRLKNTLSDFGSVSRGECFINERGNLKAIVERTNIEKRDGQIVGFSSDGSEKNVLEENTIVSMNFWGFTDKILELFAEGFESFLASDPDENEEYFLPAVVDGLLNTGLAKVQVLTTDDQWLGITHREDQSWVESEIIELLKRGIYPANLWENNV